MELAPFIGPINQRFLTSMSVAFRTPEIIIKICEDMTTCIFYGMIIIFHQIFRKILGPKCKESHNFLTWTIKKKKPQNQVMDCRQWSIWFSISQVELRLKTRKLHPAHGNCQILLHLLWSLSFLDVSPRWLVAPLFVFPSYHQVLWLELPGFLFLLPHGPLLQRCSPGSYITALQAGKTTAS